MSKYQLLVDHGIKSVYISNKMRGLPNCGRGWFDETREALRAMGIKVYCPVELDRIFPCPFADHASQEAWRHFMQRDLECILQAKPDAILLGPQWQRSPGANIEAAVAGMVIGARVYMEDGMHVYPLRVNGNETYIEMSLDGDRYLANGNSAS